MEKSKEDLKRIFKILFLAAIVFWGASNTDIIMSVIHKLLDVLSPFIFGGFLAFVINIPMSAIEKKILKPRKNKKTGKEFVMHKGIARGISLIIALAIITLILSGIINLILPEVINVIELLIEKIPYYSEKLQYFLDNSAEAGLFIEEILDGANLSQTKLKTEFMSLASGIVTSSFSIIKATLNVVIDFIISIVFAAYILISKEKIIGQFNRLFKAYLSQKWYRRIAKVSILSAKTFSSFFTVQCFEATLLGLLCILGMLLLRIPYAVTIGVFIGVTALIPIVGAFLGIIIGALLILSVESSKVLTFIIFVFILQQIETNLIYPKVVGDSVGLPGIWVLVSVSVGGSLFGIVGMLLAVPTTFVVYSLLKENVKERLESKEQ